jgi:hypothetical protein
MPTYPAIWSVAIATNRCPGSLAAVKADQPGAGFECGIAFIDPGLVNREHGRGVRSGHRLDPR